MRRGLSLVVLLLPLLLLVVKIALVVLFRSSCWSSTRLVLLVPPALLVLQVALVVLVSDRAGLHGVLLLPLLPLVVHVAFVVLASGAGGERMAVLVKTVLHIPLLPFEFAVALCLLLSLRICGHEVLLIPWVVMHWRESVVAEVTLLALVVLRLVIEPVVSGVMLPGILVCYLVSSLLFFVLSPVE